MSARNSLCLKSAFHRAANGRIDAYAVQWLAACIVEGLITSSPTIGRKATRHLGVEMIGMEHESSFYSSSCVQRCFSECG